MRKLLRIALPLLLLLIALPPLVAWQLRGEQKSAGERELEWLAGWVQWARPIDRALRQSDPVRQCGDGPPREAPTADLRRAAVMALRACRRLARGAEGESLWLDAWDTVDANLVWSRDLPVRDARLGESGIEPRLGRIAERIAGVEAEVRCWSPRDWTIAVAEWKLLTESNLEPVGLANTATGRIDLAPFVCEPLGRFFYGLYTPHLNVQTYDLAQALVTLAHEAEHLRRPSASEAAVQCYALQDLRPLVRTHRSASYADEIAGLAFDLGYPEEPDLYRTRDCRDGGELDLNPGSSVWP